MKKIMIIDDEPGIREALVDLLSDVNTEVEEFATATQALVSAQNTAYDLIITDLRMPGIDGIEFMARLRKDNVQTPVILMTAFADKDIIKKAWDLGAIEFLEKPVEFEKLRELVTTYLSSGVYIPPNVEDENLKQGVRRLNIFLKIEDYMTLKALAAKVDMPVEAYIEDFLQNHLLQR